MPKKTRDKRWTWIKNRKSKCKKKKISGVTWSNAETKALLRLYEKYKPMVGTVDLRNLKQMWNMMAQEINKMLNTTFSSKHVDNRCRVLERSYKTYKDYQKKNGRPRRYFEYLEEMERIMEDQGNVNSSVPLDTETIEKIKEQEVQFDNQSPKAPRTIDDESAKQDNNLHIYEQAECEDPYQDDDKLFIGDTVIMEESKNLLNFHEQAEIFGRVGTNLGFSIKKEKDAEYAEQDNHSHINEQSSCEDLYQNDDKLFIGETVIKEESKNLLNFHEQVGTLGEVETNSGFSIKKEKDAECAEQDNHFHINEQSPCEDLYQDDDKLFIGETVIMEESKNLLNCHELARTFVGEEKNYGFPIKKEDAECGQQNNNLHSEPEIRSEVDQGNENHNIEPRPSRIHQIPNRFRDFQIY